MTATTAATAVDPRTIAFILLVCACDEPLPTALTTCDDDSGYTGGAQRRRRLTASTMVGAVISVLMLLLR